MNAVKNILQLLLCIRCLSTASLCQISDGNLLRLKETIVCSLGGDPNCDKLERPAQGDWPNQGKGLIRVDIISLSSKIKA